MDHSNHSMINSFEYITQVQLQQIKSTLEPNDLLPISNYTNRGYYFTKLIFSDLNSLFDHIW